VSSTPIPESISGGSTPDPGAAGCEHPSPLALCPVTGEPVITRPQWTDIPLASDHRLTVEVIGDGIVYSRPSGVARLASVRLAMEIIESIVRSRIGDDRRYVHIGDFTELEGVTLGARRYYIDFMRSRSNLAGLVYCGVRPGFRWTIQIARRLRILRADVGLVADRDDALRWAAAALATADGRSRSAVPTGGSEAGAPREWEYRGTRYRMRFRILSDDIAHGEAIGYLGSQDVSPVIDMCRRVAEDIASRGKPVRAIIDGSRIDGISIAGRRDFVREFKRLHQRQPIDLLVFCGANVLLRGALAIWRPLISLPVVTAKDFDSGLRMLRRHAVGRRPLGGLFGAPARTDDRRSSPSTERQMDELLRFLGTIDWEQDGVADDIRPLASGEPLAPIFDAVMLLKSELDQQLRERRAAEAALRTSEERYRTILDDIVDGYYEIDLDGNLTFCNDSMLRMLGYRRDEIHGLRARDSMDREHAKRMASEFARVHATDRPARALSWELIRSDGRRIPVEASISVIRNQGGDAVGYRGIVRDITERVQTERERDELESRLLHAQRMEAIGTLAGGISHNFNNLLMGIQGNVSLVRRDLDPYHHLQRRLATIEDLVQNGSRLTRQLLGYAREGRYEIRVIDLNRLVERTAETFSSARKEIRVRLQLADGLPRVLADRGQIEQVLLNLLVNGAEAMPDGGDIFVTTEQAHDKHDPSGSYEAGSESYLRLSVRDTGVGMSSETVQRIFDPFFTTKGLSGGTGLGLASVYGTINAHGGYIEVTSDEGKGSTFAIYLPSTRETADESDATDDDVVLGRGTVLVVDDDPAVLEACASILSHLRYNPICASTGTEAIEMFSARMQEIDMVILDMILPDIGGGDVYDAMKAVDPGVLVLLSSGYSLDGQAQLILERGCNDFIQKPFTIEQLSQKMGAVLNRG